MLVANQPLLTLISEPCDIQWPGGGRERLGITLEVLWQGLKHRSDDSQNPDVCGWPAVGKQMASSLLGTIQ